MQRLLVTGANGFLGRHLVRTAAPGYCVIAQVRNPSAAIGGALLVLADLAVDGTLHELMRQAKPDAVIHAAAMSSPNACEQAPDKSLAVNAEVPALLARLTAEAHVPFVFVSTDLVFDGRKPPYSEQDSPCPISVYARHKAMAEEAVTHFHPSAVVARMPLMFGALPGSVSFLEPMLDALDQGREVRLFSDEYRTPVSGGTAAKGLLMAIEKRLSGMLHLGGEERASRLDMGRLAAQLAGVDPAGIIEARQADVPMPAPRPADVSLDSSKAFALGYAPGTLRREIGLALAASGRL